MLGGREPQYFALDPGIAVQSGGLADMTFGNFLYSNK